MFSHIAERYERAMLTAKERINQQADLCFSQKSWERVVASAVKEAVEEESLTDFEESLLSEIQEYASTF